MNNGLLLAIDALFFYLNHNNFQKKLIEREKKKKLVNKC